VKLVIETVSDFAVAGTVNVFTVGVVVSGVGVVITGAGVVITGVGVVVTGVPC
jgi:hypothetical protein